MSSFNKIKSCTGRKSLFIPLWAKTEKSVIDIIVLTDSLQKSSDKYQRNLHRHLLKFNELFTINVLYENRKN